MLISLFLGAGVALPPPLPRLLSNFRAARNQLGQDTTAGREMRVIFCVLRFVFFLSIFYPRSLMLARMNHFPPHGVTLFRVLCS